MGARQAAHGQGEGREVVLPRLVGDRDLRRLGLFLLRGGGRRHRGDQCGAGDPGGDTGAFGQGHALSSQHGALSTRAWLQPARKGQRASPISRRTTRRPAEQVNTLLTCASSGWKRQPVVHDDRGAGRAGRRVHAHAALLGRRGADPLRPHGRRLPVVRSRRSARRRADPGPARGRRRPGHHPVDPRGPARPRRRRHRPRRHHRRPHHPAALPALGAARRGVDPQAHRQGAAAHVRPRQPHRRTAPADHHRPCRRGVRRPRRSRPRRREDAHGDARPPGRPVNRAGGGVGGAGPAGAGPGVPGPGAGDGRRRRRLCPARRGRRRIGRRRDGARRRRPRRRGRPDSPEAAGVVERIAPEGDRAALADQLERFTDARVERYWALLGVVNGWPAWPSQIPAFEWFIAALPRDVTGVAGTR